MSCIDKAVILPISTRDLDFYWHFVSEYIERALEHADWVSLESIQSDIENHTRQLWVIKDNGRYIAAVVTRIHEYPEIKIGEISLAGGEFHTRWDHFVDVIGEWFKGHGCAEMSIIGRAGWERLYRKRGFKVHAIELRRNLEHG